MAASSYIHSHSVIHVCATVLATKPYSGYYHCCVHCMGKLTKAEDRTGNGVRYWCRRCSQQYDYCDVTQRYCVAMTVSDQSSTTGTQVVMFGETLNSIFGLPATQFHQCLHQRFSQYVDSMEVPDRINQALRCVLVGKCVLLSFPKQAVTVSGYPVTLAKLRNRTSTTQIIACGVQLLGNQRYSVLTILENNVLGSEDRNNKQPAGCVLASQTSNASSFFGESQPESGSCISGVPFHLESYCEQTSSTPHTAGTVTPSSPHEGSLGPRHSTLISSDPSTIQQSPLSYEEVHQPYDSNNQMPSKATSFSAVGCTLNETILHELITDWESSQHGGQVVSSDAGLAESELQFSEDVLKELQLNFDPSQCGTCSQLKSNHSSFASNQLDSPEMFSNTSTSASNSHFESPELFESSLQMKNTPTTQSLHCQGRSSLVSSAHDILTPSIKRTRHQLVKRTLLLEKPSTPLHPLTNSTSVVYNTPKEQVVIGSTPSNFTPDLL